MLIDFSDSIFRAGDYAPKDTPPPAPRKKAGRIGRFLARITYGNGLAIEANVAKFLALLGPRAKVLAIGAGTIGAGLAPLYEAHDVVGTDVYPSPHVALICDGHKLPFVDGCFDAVIIQAVLEHVLEPHRVADEIWRVLKPEGIVYAGTPFMQQVHEGAYDFTRFTHSGHRWLFRRFSEIDSGAELGPVNSLMWAIRYFVQSLGASSRTATLVTAACAWVRLFPQRDNSRAALDAANGVYFIGKKSDQTMRANELPAYYGAVP